MYRSDCGTPSFPSNHQVASSKIFSHGLGGQQQQQQQPLSKHRSRRCQIRVEEGVQRGLRILQTPLPGRSGQRIPQKGSILSGPLVPRTPHRLLQNQLVLYPQAASLGWRNMRRGSPSALARKFRLLETRAPLMSRWSRRLLGMQVRPLYPFPPLLSCKALRAIHLLAAPCLPGSGLSVLEPNGP